jgi:hypothetical protein
MRPFLFGLVSLLISCARVDDGSADEATISPLAAAAPAAVVNPDTPLAVLSTSTSHVEWLAPGFAGDTPEVVINVTGPTAALLHPDFVDRVGPLPAYLAATTQPLPAALRPYATRDDFALEADPTARAKLRAENEAIRTQVTRANLAAGLSSGPTTASNSCTASQAAFAANHYGAAYSAGGGSSGSKTCGQSLPFQSVGGRVFYCNIPGADCDYELAQEPVCDANSCTTVQGFTTALRARFATTPGAGANFQHFAERYRFAYYNCSSVDDAQMRRRRNGGAWTNTVVPPLWIQIRVGGHGYPPPFALARELLSFAAWKEAHNWTVATAQSPITQMNMVTQTNGFLCGDLIQRFETEELFQASCNGGKALCEDTPCSDSCW